MTTPEIITQLGIGGIFALLIIREVLGFYSRRRMNGLDAAPRGRSNTDKFRTIQNGVDQVLCRLDRIIERLEDVADATREARKQSQVTSEMVGRMGRAIAALEETIAAAGRRRTADTNPG